MDLKGMVYLSSLEVYGTPSTKEFIKETDYGYIDPLSVRSSYSEGKRMVECLCASYGSEYQIPVKIARLSQTFGPGVDYNDGRVFAEFMRCALEKKDIILHTEGKTVRTYCYIKDAISALLYIILLGESGQAYNVTNMETAVSIKEMATLVNNTLADGKINVIIDIPTDLASYGYNPEMIIRLDSTQLVNLGWKATVGLEEMYKRMAKSF
ncbi:dTDP-glucose 4,6-dehydratase [Lachnospiraceae bacterium TWA4]|nr:dTDP-glucose 4,6-dehydratase [Lachnospiraceae bacterium TWA4]